MQINELRKLVEQQLNLKVNRLRTSKGTLARTSKCCFNKDVCSYTGKAKVTGAPVEFTWEFQKQGEDWYFSSAAM